MKYNLFDKNLIYSFDDDVRHVLITKLENKIADTEFMIDDKAMEMIDLLKPCEFKLGKNLIMKGAKGRYTAQLLEKPFEKPILKATHSVEIDFNILLKAKDFTANNSRMPILNGVFVSDNGNIFASDAYVAYRHIVNEEYVDKGIVIPSDYIDFIKSYINDDTIILNYDNNKCYVETENYIFVGRLLDGNFPNVNKIFQNVKTNFVINYDYEEIKNYLKFANKVGGDVIYLDFEKNKLTARGNNKFEIESNKNDDFEFTLTLNYFNKVFNKINNVDIKYCDKMRPVIINEEYLILPVRKG